MYATVQASFKTTWHKNPISGHEWPEHNETGKFHVSGAITNRQFNTEKAAQEWADYLNKTWSLQ